MVKFHFKFYRIICVLFPVAGALMGANVFAVQCAKPSKLQKTGKQRQVLASTDGDDRPWPNQEIWKLGLTPLTSNSDILVVPGAYSSGSLIFETARAHQVLNNGRRLVTVHVVNESEIDSSLAKPSNGSIDLEIPWSAYAGNTERLVEILNGLGGKILAVLPGYEDSVILSHQLQISPELRHEIPRTAIDPGPLQSKSKLSQAVKNSSHWIDGTFSSFEDFKIWLNKISIFENHQQLMLKPDLGAASFGNKVVSNLAEAKEQFEKILGLKLTNGQTSTHVHVSEYITDPEFAVNFSKYTDPKNLQKTIFKVSSLVYMRKVLVDGHPLYDQEFLLDPYDPEIKTKLVRLIGSGAENIDLKKLLQHTENMASEIGFLNGPAHPEIFWSFNNQGQTFDVAGRLMGGQRPLWVGRASHFSDVYYAIASMINPKLFSKLPKFNRPHSHAGVVFLHTKQGGVMSGSAVAELKNLKSLRGIKSEFVVKVAPPGAVLPKTKDIHEFPGVIELTLPFNKGSFEDLIADMETIRTKIKWVIEKP